MHRAPKTEGHSWALSRVCVDPRSPETLVCVKKPERVPIFYPLSDQNRQSFKVVGTAHQLPLLFHCFFHFYDPLLVVFFRRLELGLGVWTKVKFPWLPYRLGWIENSPRAQAGLPRRFCIVVPWATEYHTVQPQVNSCGLKRNRLLGRRGERFEKRSECFSGDAGCLKEFIPNTVGLGVFKHHTLKYT